ncbi:hypothetical protein HDU91_002486, partial [Kappamyces sp. JEL0680]
MRRLYKNFTVIREFKDKRIQLTNEALLGIRIIKYMAWETKFLARLEKARDDELRTKRNLMSDNIIVQLISSGSAIVITFVSFFAYTIIAKNELDSATAFTAISLLATLTNTLQGVSFKISQLLEVSVTLKRINSFLAEDELEKFNGEIEDGRDKPDTWIGFHNADISYFSASAAKKKSAGADTATSDEQQALLDAPEEKTFSLRNINIVFPRGQLTAIIGPTGSGKTSLLLALLGEMDILKGTYSIPEHHLLSDSNAKKSDIAYVPQIAWLMNGTIRENILFGEAFNQSRYENVIKACALLKDLDNLEYGDLTEIGEKGVNLSGGQKQRLSLARAAYSTAPIILLDDPLSAVDAPTARHLLLRCILDLFQGRTVILVTHAVNLVLPQSHYVVVMKNGSVLAQGSPGDIASNPLVSEMVSNDIVKIMGEDELQKDDLIPLKSVAQTENKEGKATGSVKSATYWSYISASGGLGFLALVVSMLGLVSVGDYLKNWWIHVWTDA